MTRGNVTSRPPAAAADSATPSVRSYCREERALSVCASPHGGWGLGATALPCLEGDTGPDGVLRAIIDKVDEFPWGAGLHADVR
jgi:hypothetical protein